MAHQFIAFVNDHHEVIEQLLLACPLSVRLLRLCVLGGRKWEERKKNKETVRSW